MAFGNNLNKITNSFTQDTLFKGLSQILPVRVISIDQSNSLNNGTIIGEVILQQSNQPYKSRITASPISSNTKNYPLVNEVVFIISGPTGKYSSNSSETKYYYLTSLNLWNNPNTNPTPSPYTNISPQSENKTISEIELGSPNKSVEVDNNQFKPGTYFTEKSNIFPLYPFEGDYIIEGRFGNSIRFGSTDVQSTNATQTPLNSWSTFGSNGDPITILRNGQSVALTGSAQSLVVEDINKDLSSIYLTSTQQLPIEVASQNDYLSYGKEKPIAPNQYVGAQVVLNSGRLLFNTTQDHIMLSSQKSINLNSVDGVNIDTTGPVVLEAPEIKLGSNDATESVLLGDSTVDLLQNLISDLSSLLKIMGSQIGNNGILLEPMGTTARTISNNLDTYQTQLDGLKSNIVKVE